MEESPSSSLNHLNNGRSQEINDLYTGKLLYHQFKDHAPRRRNANSAESVPLQVVLPDKFRSTSLAIATSSTHTSSSETDVNPAEDDNEPIAIYSSRNLGMDETRRWRLVIACISILLPLNLVLAISVYFTDKFAISKHMSPLYDQLNFAGAIIATVAIVIGMIIKSNVVLSAVIIAYCIDALVNLIKLMTVLQFFEFLIQICLCYLVNEYRKLVISAWYLMRQ